MSILTKSTLLTAANVIKNETTESANTATRVGTQLVNEVDTLFNLFCRIDKVGTYGLKYTISGYDPSDVELQVVKWHKAGKCWRFVSGAGLRNQHQDSLENKFVDADAAKTARPRVTLTNGIDTINYKPDQPYSQQAITILNEMQKLRTIEHFEHSTSQGGAVWYNADKAGGYYNCEAHSYDGGAGIHFNSPRYGLAITYRGVIVSNVLPVKIGYNPVGGTMVMRNV